MTHTADGFQRRNLCYSASPISYAIYLNSIETQADSPPLASAQGLTATYM